MKELERLVSRIKACNRVMAAYAREMQDQGNQAQHNAIVRHLAQNVEAMREARKVLKTYNDFLV